MRSKLAGATAGSLMLALSCGTAAVHAADMPTYEETVVFEETLPEWTFSIAPYFWMAGLSGDIAQFGAPPVEVDVKFADILKSLDFSMMVVGEARHGRFSVFTDLLYLKVSANAATPRGVFANTIGLGAKTFEMTGLAGYAIIDTPAARLDLVAGARLWSVENTISFAGGPLGGLWLRGSRTWVDAMGGVRGRVNFTPQFYATGWAIAGGGSSDFGWDVMGGVGYEFSDRFSAVVGYRAAGVDYQDGPFLYDVTMQGPILGAVIRF